MHEGQLDQGSGFLRAGTRISDRYIVVRPLGEGGMGQVYEVEHEAIGRHFALKLLNISPCTDELLRRFRREARALGRVTSPRVAQVTDFGFEQRLGPYYVMELLDGETLEDRLEREHYLPAAQALPIAIDLCEALNEVHATGIIHRDLKPSNVGLTRGGAVRVKLLDFGLATAAEGAFFERITRSQEVVGSLPYMAPERFYNAKLTRSVDLYSLGVVLYEILTGRLPYDGQSAAILINQHLNAEPPPFHQVVPELDIPPALEVIVNRLLDKDPGQRFNSAAAVGRALYAATIDAPLPTLADVGDGPVLASTLYGSGDPSERPASPTASEPVEVPPFPYGYGTVEDAQHELGTVEDAQGDIGQAPTMEAKDTDPELADMVDGRDTDPGGEPPESDLASEPPAASKPSIPTSVVPEGTTPSTPATWTPAPSTPPGVAPPVAASNSVSPVPEGSSGESHWTNVRAPAPSPSDSFPAPSPSDSFPAPPARSRLWLKVALFVLIALIGSTAVGLVTFQIVRDAPRRRGSEPAAPPESTSPPPVKSPPLSGGPTPPPAPTPPPQPEPGSQPSAVGATAAAHRDTSPPVNPGDHGKRPDAGRDPNAGGTSPEAPPPSSPPPPSIEVSPPSPPRPRPNPRPWRGEIIESPE